MKEIELGCASVNSGPNAGEEAPQQESQCARPSEIEQSKDQVNGG